MQKSFKIYGSYLREQSVKTVLSSFQIIVLALFTLFDQGRKRYNLKPSGIGCFFFIGWSFRCDVPVSDWFS